MSRHVTGPNVCHYCGWEIGDIKNDRGLPERTKDHIVPRARGGRDERFNITWSCPTCNVTKQDNWPTCSCNVCRRSRRVHWEKYGINENSPRPPKS